MRRALLWLMLTLTAMPPVVTWANGNGSPLARIKELVHIEGIRDNHLFGYGLVVGLAGTGDGNTGYTQQSIASLMRNMGVPVDPNAVKTRSVASVLVTAKLPPFARPGATIDVTVSTVGDCKSLQGGTLMPTELRGYDNQTHAVAQGPLSLGGSNPLKGGGDMKLNHPTVATIPQGAIVEGQPLQIDILQKNVFRLMLHQPDFVVADRIKDAINRALGPRAGGQTIASAVNPGLVEVNVLPLLDAFDSLVQLIAAIEQIEIQTDEVARVVVNERTGTVVMGHNVRISRAAVSHHDYSISFLQTEETLDAPGSRRDGERLITTETEISPKDGPPFRVVPDAATVQELIDALNALRVEPRDMIAILQALRNAGALKAELVIL